MDRRLTPARTTLALVGAATLVPMALAQEDPIRVLRIYDARDILRGENAGQMLHLAARVSGGSGMGEGSGVSPFIEIVPHIDRAEHKDLLLEIGTATGMYISRVRDGIYVASGTPDAHQQLESALGAYRVAGGPRYIVNVEAVQMVSDSLPTPGRPAPDTTGVRLLRSSQTVTAQTESVVQATTSEQYVSGWVPIVGTQAVGYQAQFATAEDGFVGTLLVGSIDAPEGHVSIQLAGWLLDSQVQNKAVTIAGDTFSFGVITRQERGIQTSVNAPIGARVVLAAVNGFEPNTIIVVTGTAVPVDQK